MSTITSQRLRQMIDSCGDASDICNADIVDLESELCGLLAHIAEKQSDQDADIALLELGSLQELLSILIFKYGVEMTDRQPRIVREYDRWDDAETRVSFFNEIASGRV